MSKSDKLESNNRVRTVQEWILQGFATVDIIKQCTGKWNISERQAYRIYNKAYDWFHDLRQKGSKRRLYYHMEVRLKLYRDLKDKTSPQGARSALKILDSMAKLEGVMIEKHEVTGKDGGPIIETNTQTVVILPSNQHESKG